MIERGSTDSILDRILKIVTKSDGGKTFIDTSSLTKRSNETKAMQQALTEQGLYVSKDHKYYNDGYPGETTSFGLLMLADPNQADSYIKLALKDNALRPNDIIKLQIALNASTNDPDARIEVDGFMGKQTANRLADYLTTKHVKDIDQNSPLAKALHKYADPAKLKAIGIKDREKSRTFNNTVTKQKQPTERTHDAHDHGHAPNNEQSAALSRKIIDISEGDNAHNGYCGRGVSNILTGLGLKNKNGDGHTWKDSLPKHGWKKLDDIKNPENAPPGSVIVYDRDRNFTGKKGGAGFGHVEMVAEKDGERLYVSDKARSNWGGTVPENFVGVYVHPELTADLTNQNTTLASSNTSEPDTHGLI